jgi:thiol-disulfide isomerase/thioredoxin
VQYAPPAAVTSAADAGALAAALSSFLGEVAAGSAPPRVISAPVPAHNDAPVTVVVGHTFESIVRREGVDVLLEIHAPWCGHCKALWPEYEALGARLSTSPSLTVARLDGTTNEVPGLEYEDYPTLLLYTASNRVVEVGDEVERTADGLEAFLRAHAEKPIVPAAKDEL